MSETVTCTIDGIEVTVPKNTLIIRAAEQIGIQVPRFCDHPLLEPLGACRQCIVEVEGQRKPLTSCTTTVTDGMVVKTQLTSEVADKAQRGTIEFLLLNHPLDCPVCDKGGECPLQNQALSNGPSESRFRDEKRTYEKPIAISSQVLLDRERCVLCARCTRFSQQIAGDPFIELFERGALEQVAVYADEPFNSYFSGNTVQICPVGALTGAQYRFRARPFDLVSTASVCEHCASGCQQRSDWRRGKVLRRLAGDDPDVNEEWNCDKGRWAFQYATAKDRLREPLVRDADGYLVAASWTDALGRAALGLDEWYGKVGVLTGGRLTVEDAYAYAKFARLVLGTDDVDFRARVHSAEEAQFLAAHVAGRYLDTTYADVEAAPAVLTVGLDPEEESPILFLRLRKAALTGRLSLFDVAPFGTNGLRKCSGRLLQTLPGGEAQLLAALADGSGAGGSGFGDSSDEGVKGVREALGADGAVILVGERLAGVPGALSAAARLATATGAKLAWVPRRAGDRGALEAGCLPGLLPGGRPLTDAGARAELITAWGIDELPEQAGRSTEQILRAAAAGEIALVVAGVDVRDLPDPELALEALANAPFVLSLELRESPVTERADVVFPVAPAVEKAGSYLDWEGRVRPFETTLEGTGSLPDGRVLHRLAEVLQVDLGLPDVTAAQAELQRLGAYAGSRAPAANVEPARPADPGPGSAVLATWHRLLDDGRLQDDEPYLAGTRRPTVALLSETTAKEIGADGVLTVSTDRGSVTVPFVIADLPDRVVWLPTMSAGCHVAESLGAVAGDVVRIAAGAST
jgi:NADH-quinone oxidoreductase subunit G